MTVVIRAFPSNEGIVCGQTISWMWVPVVFTCIALGRLQSWKPGWINPNVSAWLDPTKGKRRSLCFVFWINWPANAHQWVFWLSSIFCPRARKTFYFPVSSQTWLLLFCKVHIVFPVALLILLGPWKNTLHSTSSWPPPQRRQKCQSSCFFSKYPWGLGGGGWAGLSLSDHFIKHTYSKPLSPSTIHFLLLAIIGNELTSLPFYPHWVIFLHWKGRCSWASPGGQPALSALFVHMLKPDKVHLNNQMSNKKKK